MVPGPNYSTTLLFACTDLALNLSMLCLIKGGGWDGCVRQQEQNHKRYIVKSLNILQSQQQIVYSCHELR